MVRFSTDKRHVTQADPITSFHFCRLDCDMWLVYYLILATLDFALL